MTLKIRLNAGEKEILSEVIQRYRWKHDLQVTDHSSNVSVAEIDEGDATDLRELCSDYLSETGFDADYNTNEKGKVLETLVDKLFVP